MEWVIQESIQLAKATIHLQVAYIGKDLLIILSGAEEHIGCVVQSFPRPSLKGNHKISASSSILNVIGHKDDYLCRYVAEYFSKAFESMVVCTGGIHIENATESDIQELLAGIKNWIPKIIDKMKRV